MEEKISPGSPGAQLRAASILFNAMVIGVLLFLAVAIGLIKISGRFSGLDESFDKIFLGIVAVAEVLYLTAMFFKRPTKEKVINYCN